MKRIQYPKHFVAHSAFAFSLLCACSNDAEDTASGGSNGLGATASVGAVTTGAGGGSTSSSNGSGGSGGGAEALCASASSKEFVRPFEVDGQDYPFDSCVFDSAAGRIHFFDEGPRDASHTVLFVHGNPTWSFLYRNVAKAMIAEGHRVVAVDHLGMGMSDAPEVSQFDYRPRSHSANLEALVTALDLSNVTLVVQDWGGPVGLRVAARQPDRFERFLIMNSWAWPVDETAPGMDHALVAWGQLARSLGESNPLFGCTLMLPLTADAIAKEVDPTEGSTYDTVRAAYLAPALDVSTLQPLTDADCAAMSTFALSILAEDSYLSEVEQGLSAVAGKPYALFSGLRDELFGALRCDMNAASPCSNGQVCVCDPDYTLFGSCDSKDLPETRRDFVCKAEGQVVEANMERWVDLLGAESLVARGSAPSAEHMVQEFALDGVIDALETLLAEPPR